MTKHAYRAARVGSRTRPRVRGWPDMCMCDLALNHCHRRGRALSHPGGSTLALLGVRMNLDGILRALPPDLVNVCKLNTCPALVKTLPSESSIVDTQDDIHPHSLTLITIHIHIKHLAK